MNQEEIRYLKWYNKIGYGSGDVAGNVVYAFLTAFVMFYLTDTMGLNIGIVGTLIAIAKILDGITDLFFGIVLDKTHTKMGKARPWMLWPYLGCAISLIACFSIPETLGETAQYIFFFISYTLLNAVFFTSNNIAYSSLTALITKNTSERVQLGSIRFIFALGTNMLIQYITIDTAGWFGGGAHGWKCVAIIYAMVGLVINTISVFSVKELPETCTDTKKENKSGITLLKAIGLLMKNKYYVIICAIYFFNQLSSVLSGMGIYYMKYILGNENLIGKFALASNIPVIIMLLILPFIIEKTDSMYKLNIVGYVMATLGKIGVMLAAYMGNVPIMLGFTAVAAIGLAPLQGDINALVASCSEYTAIKTGHRLDGMMYSCTSLGLKTGGALATAICVWLLDAAGYVENAAVQTENTIAMLKFLYLWGPAIICAIVLFFLTLLKVEQANKRLMEEKHLKQN